MNFSGSRTPDQAVPVRAEKLRAQLRQRRRATPALLRPQRCQQSLPQCGQRCGKAALPPTIVRAQAGKGPGHSTGGRLSCGGTAGRGCGIDGSPGVETSLHDKC
jgi:hypothetical protein